MINLVRGGKSTDGGSLWHIDSGAPGLLTKTICESILHADTVQGMPLAEYSGGRRLSLCSYCLKGFDRIETSRHNNSLHTNCGTNSNGIVSMVETRPLV